MCHLDAQDNVYVDARAAGANNGASWADSYTDLQAALGASVGGEIWVAEGVYYYTSSQPVLANVTFTGNTAPHGSAICNVGGGFKLVNGIVWDNTTAPEQIYNDHTVPNITYSDIAGGWTGTGNLQVDPLFGDLDDNGSPDQGYTLLVGSPAIDTGSPTGCPATDQAGLARPVDGDGDGQAAV